MNATEAELQAEVKKAYDALGAAWNQIRDTQEKLTDAGVPEVIVRMLDKPRLAVNDTSMFPDLVDVLSWRYE
jgi:hypothetical protein